MSQLIVDQSGIKLQYKTVIWHDTTHFDSANDYIAQIVQMSFTVNNSPTQDYAHTDNHAPLRVFACIIGHFTLDFLRHGE